MPLFKNVLSDFRFQNGGRFKVLQNGGRCQISVMARAISMKIGILIQLTILSIFAKKIFCPTSGFKMAAVLKFARFLAHLLTDRNETWPTESSCYEVVLLTFSSLYSVKSAEREATSTFRET